jgi:hypothetical protein
VELIEVHSLGAVTHFKHESGLRINCSRRRKNCYATEKEN